MNFCKNLTTRNIFIMLQSWPLWKSILSSVITAAVDLSLLFFLRGVLVWPSLLSVNTAFAVAILVNFTLQKFWTFSNKNLRGAHKQFVKFLGVSAVNMVMNGIIMFFLVSVLGLWYIGAQVIVMVGLAVMNFMLYRIFVFK